MDQQEKGLTIDHATSAVALAVVAGGTAAIVYVGGKTAVLTACAVGGGLFAGMVAFQATKMALTGTLKGGLMLNAWVKAQPKSVIIQPDKSNSVRRTASADADKVAAAM